MEETYELTHYTLPSISQDNYMEILHTIGKWELKGQGYICVAHAYLGAIAYTIYENGWWRKEFHSWKSFCEDALQRPYSTVSAAYNNYKTYVVGNKLTLQEYLEVLSLIGVASVSQLRKRKLPPQENLLEVAKKIKEGLSIKTLEKEEEKFVFLSFRLEKDQYASIISTLEVIEKKVGIKPSPHLGERLHNCMVYVNGLL